MISNADFNTIAALDLDPIKVKLMHKESGEGWSLEQANAVEVEYRRFLYLMKLFPHEQTAPLFNVDTFWHYHILDTMKYEADCAVVFGYFLHHFPYIGLRGDDDEAAHQRVGERMRELYEATFGESYTRRAEATAWSGATADTAWSGATTKTAWSGATAPAEAKSAGQTAWSGAHANTAWSGATVQPANAAEGTIASLPKTAWSGATVNAAWSGATRQAPRPAAGAMSGVTAWPGSVSQSTATPVDRFYAARPGLRAAA